MAWERVRIVIIKPEGYTHAGAFLELAEVLAAGFRQLGVPTSLAFNDFETGSENLVLGWHLVPENQARRLPDGCILYNLEQLGGPNSPFLPRLAALSSRCRIWDYSERNISFLKAHGFPAPVRWVPIGTTREMTRIESSPEPDIDVLFYGSINDRRKAVLDGLAEAGARVHHAFDVYGRERDTLIARAKVVLNLHYYEASIFEMVRVSYLMANRKAVVAERNANTEVDEALGNAVVLAPYEELIPACMALLQDSRRMTALQARAFEYMTARAQPEILRPILAEEGQKIPAVSVVVITRDRPFFLGRALRSLQAQTFRDFEVLVVNDCGVDISTPVAQAREQGLDARLFTNPEQRGQSACRNLAIRHARGTWIAYLDDDDFYYSDHLETLVEALRRTGAQVAYTDSMRAVEEERKGQWVEVSRELAMSNDFSRERFLTDNLTPINNVMHARTCWDIVGHHDETLPVLEDWDFWIRLSRKWDFLHIPKATAEVRWRANGANITFMMRDQFPPCRARIAAKVQDLLRAEALMAEGAPRVGREGFLLEPDWSRPEWLEILFSFFTAFVPGEPVALILLLREESLSLDQAQALVLDMVNRSGRKVFPDVELVDATDDLRPILGQYQRVQWVPTELSEMLRLEGPNGLRLASARERFHARVAQPRA